MLSAGSADGPLPEDLRIELDGLRRGLLDTLFLLTLGAPVVWLAYLMLHAYASDWVDVGVLQLIVGVSVALVLRQRNLTGASWSYLLSLSVCYASIVLAHPEHPRVSLAVPIVILAQALLDGWQSALLAAIVSALGIGAQTLAGVSPVAGHVRQIVSAAALAWAATWLTKRQLQVAIGWALSGWERTDALLRETRQRRGEVYSDLKALEEATYRIERMNRELVYARSEAERARAFKAHYATTISHELRGPLSLILGFSRFMVLSPERYDDPLPSSYYADIDAIYRNAQHLSSLLDDILDLAQIEAERLPLLKTRLDLEQEVCIKAAEIVKPLAERKGLTMTLVMAGNLPDFVADGVRLRQVLLNLLTNAIRHTDQGGITLLSECHGNVWRLTVSDTGSGIPAEHLPRLFDEFYQTPSDRDHKGSSGLGLAISRQLVELHGGRMWVESALGQGTSFFVTLPLPGTVLTDSQTNLVAGPTQKDEVRRQEIPVCLMLHAPPSVSRLLSRYLEGYRVISMDDQEHAMSTIADLDPTAVLLPVSRADEFARRLSDADYEVPIITCQFPESVQKDSAQGVLARLAKPVSEDVLTSLLHKVESDGQTTILLVDDEPDYVRMTENMLMALSRPYRIIRAYDGQQAMDLMSRDVPDVVVIDEVMPRMNGSEVISAMRQNERLLSVPIIVISANDIEGPGLVLETPLSIVTPASVDLGHAAKGLCALLDMLRVSHARQSPLPPRQAALSP